MTLKTSKDAADQVTACILAGGKGSRFDGIDKGLLKVSDKYLIEHSLIRIRPQVKTILISANRNFDTYRALEGLVIADSFGNFEGPLAGFLSGLEHSKTPYLITLPCDAPLFPHDLVCSLMKPIVAGKAQASVARVAGKLQPTFSCLTTGSINSLRRHLNSGERKIFSWLERLKLKIVDFENEVEFTNINNPEDLEAASKYLSNDAKL